MPKNDKAREKKVNVAVKALMRFPGMRVREAMHFAQFLKKEIDNVRIVSRRQFRAAEAAGPPKNVCHDADASLDVSSLSEEADVAAANATTSIVLIIDEIIPPPKRIKQRMTACAMEKKRVKDRKQKKHRSLRRIPSPVALSPSLSSLSTSSPSRRHHRPRCRRRPPPSFVIASPPSRTYRPLRRRRCRVLP